MMAGEAARSSKEPDATQPHLCFPEGLGPALAETPGLSFTHLSIYPFVHSHTFTMMIVYEGPGLGSKNTLMDQASVCSPGCDLVRQAAWEGVAPSVVGKAGRCVEPRQ